MTSIPACWSIVPDSDGEALWTAFDALYSFLADTEPEGWPGIGEPVPSVTYDLTRHDGDLTWSAVFERVNAEALTAFKEAFLEEADLVVLDWQHPTYRIDHHLVQAISEQDADERNLPTPYPDGDYHAFMSSDMSGGTFGHPWERTLCVIGPRLGSSLVPALDLWLPRLPINGRAA